ncbi:MAG: ABC transporter permease [Deltaproteobacteria bacterium]|nr:ABC transporter permease [Deltaproteobacteria bacterium]MBI4374578.1 ABC transporter permease [Deltaproteobacteria bacterium]
MGSDLTWLAVRFLFPKRENRFFSAATLVAILAVSVGVASLLVSLSVISGFQQVYKESILKFNSHLVLTGAGEIGDPEAVWESLPEEMRREVVGWHPFIYREGMMIAGGKLRGVVLKGVEFKKIAALSHLKIDTTEAVASAPSENPGIFPGSRLARELGEGRGTVRFLLPNQTDKEKIQTFEIQGSFESGMYDYDSSFALVSLETAQKIFQLGKQVTGVEFWFRDPDRAFYWSDSLRGLPDFPYFPMTWREINENLFRALETEKIVFFILMAVLTAVGTFNLLSSIIMMILGKRSQIATLRVLGLPWFRLRKLFLFDALLVGCAGLLGGLSLGAGLLFVLKRWGLISLSPEVYFVSQVPSLLSGTNLLIVAGAGLTLVGVGSYLTLRGIRHLPVLRALVEK